MPFEVIESSGGLVIAGVKGELEKSELDQIQTLAIEVISKTLMEKSQNKEENEFLRSIVSTLKEIGVVAILLICDRGFRRVSWIKLLKEVEQHFVVRLIADVVVHKIFLTVHSV